MIKLGIVLILLIALYIMLFMFRGVRGYSHVHDHHDDHGHGGEEGGPVSEPVQSAADDLTRINGIGKVIEEKLHALGIHSFDQVAAFTAEDIARVNERLDFSGRIERENWVGQARDLIAARS